MAFIQQALPGTQLDDVTRKSVRERFLQTFLKDQPWHLPFWFSMSEDGTVRKDVFDSQVFLGKERVYMMVAKGERIVSALPSEVARFFHQQAPFEGKDFYIFDDTFSWCIVSTHQLAPGAVNDSEFRILRKGDL